MLLQDVHDVEFVLWEYLSKAFSVFNRLSQLRGLMMANIPKAAGIENVLAQPQLTSGFAGDGHLIARDHLDVYAHLPRGGDGRLGIRAGWIEERKDSEKLPSPLRVRPRDAQRTETARRKFVDGFLDRRLHLGGIGRQLQDHLWRALSSP